MRMLMTLNVICIIAITDGFATRWQNGRVDTVDLPQAEILCVTSDVIDSAITIQIQHVKGDTLKSMVRALEIDMLTNGGGTRWSADTLFVEASYYLCPPRITDPDSLYCLRETNDSVCYPNHVLLPGSRYTLLCLRRLANTPHAVVYISPSRDFELYVVGDKKLKLHRDHSLVLRSWIIREKPQTDCIIR